MKYQILALSFLFAIGTTTAFAQNTNSPGQPQPGKPGQPMQGQPGQPPMGQPGQPMQGQAGQPPMGQPGQPMQGQQGKPPMGQPGQQMQGQQGQPPMGQPGQQMQGQPGKPMAAWAPDKCEKQIPRMTKMADNCLKVKKEDKRRACFDQIGSKMPPGFFEGCRPLVEPIKAQYEAKEKERYPNQASAMNGDKGGDKGPHGQPGMPPQGHPTDKNAKPVDCAKIGTKIHQEADKCLKIKDTPKRKMCFDKVGEEIQKSGAEQACSDMINATKSEYQGKEGQAYPGQPSSIN